MKVLAFRSLVPQIRKGSKIILQWLTSNHEVSYEMLHLDHEKTFFQKTYFDLSHIFETGQAIQNLKEVHLDDCGLISLPTMTALSQLEVISARNNKIEKVESSFSSTLCEEVENHQKPNHMCGYRL